MKHCIDGVMCDFKAEYVHGIGPNPPDVGGVVLSPCVDSLGHKHVFAGVGVMIRLVVETTSAPRHIKRTLAYVCIYGAQ